ncbi:MAG: GNAT family N-acetyltransferase, partial [Chloroflexi bacterium]|nr:GNAT family N-acetyltransferase [Chloroflexota bacterium]
MNTKRKRSQFIVRQLRDEAELTFCSQLDHSYTTDYVWQMDMREENEDVFVRFRTVHLPRSMVVSYPRDVQTQRMLWQKRECFLVAVADDVLLGYANMHVDATGTRGWVYDLVVGEPFRRRRIGSALLD